MRVSFTTFLLLGFISIAVFGFAAMNHDSGYGHNGCIATIAQGTDCPKQESTLAFLTFHTGAFKGFSTAVFAVLTLFLISLAALAFFPDPIFQEPNFSHYFFALRLSSFASSENLISWLSLHENSPTVL